MHFLLNHPNLREDIIEVLKSRQHDVDETVRYEVVLAVVTTAKHDFEIVSQSAELLDCVKERTLDKKVVTLSTNFPVYYNSLFYQTVVVLVQNQERSS